MERPTDTTADDQVAAFLDAVDELALRIEGLTGRALDVEFLVGLRQSTPYVDGVQVGRLGGDIEYYFHGIGCRFTLPDSRLVDPDIVSAEGRSFLACDVWRVHDFGSPAAGRSDDALLEAAMQRHRRLFEVKHGWFAVAGTRRDGPWRRLTVPADPVSRPPRAPRRTGG